MVWCAAWLPEWPGRAIDLLLLASVDQLKPLDDYLSPSFSF
jgi:hypothetical protein